LTTGKIAERKIRECSANIESYLNHQPRRPRPPIRFGVAGFITKWYSNTQFGIPTYKPYWCPSLQSRSILPMSSFNEGNIPKQQRR
jgi:hypothetical protein